jgi:tryptophanyl-tRNA synthetase
MNRILTAVQCTGDLHLGNILSTIKPTIELSKNMNNEVLTFIADLHTLTSIKDPKIIEENLFKAAVVWLSMGLDIKNTIFFRQSKIKGICELTWIFNCLTPYPMLANAHAFKDKSNNLSDVNVGLFDYPVLMASDILIYQSDLVPVGKDQKQHIEITRDIAKSFNNTFGEVFKLPDCLINEKVKIVPGIDGRKMSKSYKNTIDIFAEENILRKTIMSITTDSKTPNEPKNPDECNVFNIFKSIANDDDIEYLKKRYINGGIGYKEVKDMLFELILSTFKKEREEYNKIKNEKEHIRDIFIVGEEKAQEIADETMKKVKDLLLS